MGGFFEFGAYFRVLKTPTDDLWPGVSNLPDYKANFPKWITYNLEAQVKNLDEDGLDLLKQMLVYNPSERISAKRIAKHPYFKKLDQNVSPDFTTLKE